MGAASLRPGGSPTRPLPCWKANAKGYYTYTDKNLTPSGLRQVNFVAGPAGRALVVASGRGQDLSVPALTTITGPLQVQLRRHGGGICFDSTFAAPFRKHDAWVLSAR